MRFEWCWGNRVSIWKDRVLRTLNSHITRHPDAREPWVWRIKWGKGTSLQGRGSPSQSLWWNIGMLDSRGPYVWSALRGGRKTCFISIFSQTQVFEVPFLLPRSHAFCLLNETKDQSHGFRTLHCTSSQPANALDLINIKKKKVLF